MSVTINLSAAGPDAYTVRDYYGNIVTSGPVAGTSFTVLDPVGGWKCGWYRVYLTGPNTDTNFGNSYGVYNFCVIRDTAGYAANTTTSSGHQDGSESNDHIAKGIMGIGTSRILIGNAGTYNSGSDSLAGAQNQVASILNHWRTDTARPINPNVEFPNGANSGAGLGNGTTTWALVFERDTSFEPGDITIEVVSGTNAGTYKINVYHLGTLVETYDNQTPSGQQAWCTTVLNSSSYIKAFPYNGTLGLVALRDLGSTYRLGCRTVVSTLYPLGVTHYEGFANEPRLDYQNQTLPTNEADMAAHRMMLFQHDVHVGNASAVAMGPVPVQIDATHWEPFFTFGGGAYCDEISFHAYNAVTNGDINLGRTQIEAAKAMLASHSQDGKTLWHTEATQTTMPLYGIHHPRRARVSIIQTLLWEQYGIPRERNQRWYDRSHGFWSVPTWWENDDGSLQPDAVMYRTMSEEFYGKTHHHRFDFGSVQANRMYLGSVYRASDDTGVLVVQGQSHIPGAQMTVTLLGSVPASVTVVDAWGNESTVTVTSSRVTFDVDDIPTYVRLPAGCYPRAYSVHDWGASPPPSISAKASASVGGVTTTLVTDGAYLSEYNGGTNNLGVVTSGAALPDTVELTFGSAADVDRVIVFCGGVWQKLGAFVDFDIQTTTDGVTWTTRKTVTVDDTTPTFRHGSDSHNTGCFMETYWTEQWIFDVPLGATFSCTGVRAYVRKVSNGGEPSSIDATTMGQGDNTQRITIQEILVPSASSPTNIFGNYATEVLADSPVGYWRLGETSGTSAADQTTFNHPATYNASNILGAAGAIGDGDPCFQPNGNPATVAQTTDHNLADTFSIEFWCKTSDTSTYIYCFGQEQPSSISVTTPKVQMISRHLSLVQDNNHYIVAQSSVACDNNWHHFVVTKTAADCHIYQDGVDVTAATPTQVPAPWTVNQSFVFSNDSTSSLRIGGVAGGSGFAGSFDEMALYNTVLSSTRVLAHYNAASTASATAANTTAPSVEGTATVGHQISCIPGSWNPQPNSFAFQWQLSTDSGTTWADVVGATSSDYVVAGASGNQLRCNVAGSTVAGASSAVSSSTVTIP